MTRRQQHVMRARPVRRFGKLGGPLLAICVLVAAAGCSGSSGKTTAPVAEQTAAVSTGLAALQDAYVNTVNRVRPSVVEVSTSEGLGSGVVYDNDGHIVTNAHVVGNATRFHVTVLDGRTLDGTLVASFAPDDLAVIQVHGGDLAPARFADSSRVQVGDVVLAIGNPLGLASSVTNGIVSSTGRTVSEGGGIVLPSTIQTSAAINPGNSGGGLVGIDGEIIGIPTLAATDPQLGGAAVGIGFAIPSNTVKQIASQLIAQGRVTNSGRAALGIRGADASTLSGRSMGVLVRAATAPASAAGIKAGDIITALDGNATPTLDDLATVLADLAPGRRVSVKVLHPDQTTQTYHLALGTL